VKEFKKMKTTKGAAMAEFKTDPEAFQVVMVTSDLMKEMYAEESIHTRLMGELQRKEKDYKEVFGSTDHAMGQVHKLMATVGTLPTAAKVPLAEFRRVINTNLASIAAFLPMQSMMRSHSIRPLHYCMDAWRRKREFPIRISCFQRG
jgi:NAD(P)-dependent dehydrogenase (short-subunit alcohol dehydrogenase family)